MKCMRASFTLTSPEFNSLTKMLELCASIFGHQVYSAHPLCSWCVLSSRDLQVLLGISVNAKRCQCILATSKIGKIFICKIAVFRPVGYCLREKIQIRTMVLIITRVTLNKATQLNHYSFKPTYYLIL